MREITWRINFIFVFFLIFALLLISKLFFLQIVHHKLYSVLAAGQQKWFLETEGERGLIYAVDRDNNLYPLSQNISQDFAFFQVLRLKNNPLVLEKISKVLKISKEELMRKFEENDEVVVLPISQNIRQELQKLKIEGVYFDQKFIRFYPQKDFGARFLGFLGGEGKGQYGLEGYYDNILKGKVSLVSGERNPLGYSFLIQNQLKKGSDLVLTIDYNLQNFAENLLKKHQKDLEFESGQIIIVDPQNGKILALAEYPSFDLNNYFKVADIAIFQNSLIQKIFEPGSILKPITMAAALEENKITPETTYVDEGFVKFGGSVIYNYGNRVWGEQTMRGVLEKSINTGAVFVQRLLGNKLFLDYLKKFGFFEKTGVDLQGEVFSENKNLSLGRDINLATASFGQGIEVTPLQVVRAFSAIANRGKLVKPYLVEKIIQENGKVSELEPSPPKQIISEKTAATLTEMLVSVVEEGFAKRTKIPGYYIAGKTGTAQVPFSALGIPKRGYSEKTIQSFVGYFPAFEAKFLIMVKLDNPKTKSAEYSAVPVFKEMAQYIISYEILPPDYKVDD